MKVQLYGGDGEVMEAMLYIQPQREQGIEGLPGRRYYLPIRTAFRFSMTHSLFDVRQSTYELKVCEKYGQIGSIDVDRATPGRDSS